MKKILDTLIIGMFLLIIFPYVTALDIELEQPFILNIGEEAVFNDIDPENNPITLQIVLNEIIPEHEEVFEIGRALILEAAKIDVFLQTQNEMMNLLEFDLLPDGNRMDYEEESIINLIIRQNFDDDRGILEGPTYELHVLDLEEEYVKLRLDRTVLGNPREPPEELDDEENILPEIMLNDEARHQIEVIRDEYPEIYLRYLADNHLTEREKEDMENYIEENHPEFFEEFDMVVGSYEKQSFIRKIMLKIIGFIKSIF